MIVLKRIAENEEGTYGVIIQDNQPICVTLERQWHNNQPDISCIPPGAYKCQKYSSEKFKDVWEITNVPNRTAILIHSGNSMQDTHGCVIVGREFTPFGVALSQMALADLRKLLPDEFTLTIGN